MFSGRKEKETLAHVEKLEAWAQQIDAARRLQAEELWGALSKVKARVHELEGQKKLRAEELCRLRERLDAYEAVMDEAARMVRQETDLMAQRDNLYSYDGRPQEGRK